MRIESTEFLHWHFLSQTANWIFQRKKNKTVNKNQNQNHQKNPSSNFTILFIKVSSTSWCYYTVNYQWCYLPSHMLLNQFDFIIWFFQISFSFFHFCELNWTIGHVQILLTLVSILPFLTLSNTFNLLNNQ